MLRKLRSKAKAMGPGRPLFGMKVETPKKMLKTRKDLKHLHGYGKSLAKMVAQCPDLCIASAETMDVVEDLKE